MDGLVLLHLVAANKVIPQQLFYWEGALATKNRTKWKEQHVKSAFEKSENANIAWCRNILYRREDFLDAAQSTMRHKFMEAINKTSLKHQVHG